MYHKEKITLRKLNIKSFKLFHRRARKVNKKNKLRNYVIVVVVVIVAGLLL